MRAHREVWPVAGDSQEEKVRCIGHVARGKKVVERCKGVDMAELELVEEKARGPCGLDTACQLCFNDGFDYTI